METTSPRLDRRVSGEDDGLAAGSVLRSKSPPRSRLSPYGTSWHLMALGDRTKKIRIAMRYQYVTAIPRTASEAGGRAFESRPGHHLVSRSYATRSCERCVSNHRTKPNHFPLVFLRHGSDLLRWLFTTFDLDQKFQARSVRPAREECEPPPYLPVRLNDKARRYS